MNQQRARRFKSAQEAQEKEEEEARMRREWAAQGRQVPPPKPGHSQGPGGHFDSNTIT
jgi:5'-3' exonuclease